MRAPRTITRYLLREVVTYTLLGLFTIVIVLLTRSLFRTLSELVNAGFGISELLLIVRLLGIVISVYALPIAFLFGVLLAIGRMAADVEITAMRACGLGLRAFVVPILLLGLLLTGFTMNFTLESEPAAHRQMRRAIRDMLTHGGVIEPGRFRKFGNDRICFVQQRDDDGRLYGVVISDRSDPEHPFMVFARSASVWLDEEQSALFLELESGDIHVSPPPGDDGYRRIAFERFAYGIDVGSLLEKGGGRRAKEMTMAQLERVIARVRAGDTQGLSEETEKYALHWHRRVAGPLAPTLFGLVGVPLALRRRRGARSLGLLWCVVLAAGYYMMQSLGELLALRGEIPAVAAIWTPNLCYAALGAFLLLRARRAGV